MEKNVLQLSICRYALKDDKKEFTRKATEYVCALLNSNGGTLELNAEMKADEIVRPIEQSFQKVINTFGVIKKLRISSQTSKQITLEVKGHDTICTMNYNIYLPTDTHEILVSPTEVEAVKETLNTSGIVDITETDKNVPTEFVLDRPIGIKVSKTVRFKYLKSSKSGKADLASRLQNNKFTHCVSAFANHCGGRLFCGIRDDGIVEGQKITDEEREDLTKKVSQYIKEMIWPEYCGEPQKGRHGQWDISFEPVTDQEGNPIPLTFVIVIFVAACQGGVFCSIPESYHIVEGKVERMTFAEWKRKLLYPTVRETKIAPAVSKCDWSSSKLRLECDSLDGKLLRMINNGEWNEFTEHYYEGRESLNNKAVEWRLVILSKHFMFHYRKSQYEEAENCLTEYQNCLSEAKDARIFYVRGRLILFDEKVFSRRPTP